jgi:hypothetical protein
VNLMTHLVNWILTPIKIGLDPYPLKQMINSYIFKRYLAAGRMPVVEIVNP